MMTDQPANYGKPWTRDELIVAFDLYCRIPFRKTKATNPDVMKLAALISRSTASVARKLGNFGAFDPELGRQNISGLGHTSKLDREVWDEFHNDWTRLVESAHALRATFHGDPKSQDEATSISLPDGPSECVSQTKQRLHQSFFRQAVLSSYESACCVTGLCISKCLIASHIIPWSENEVLRADPTNGLCLSATFDRLFDTGLMSITPELRIVFCHDLLLDEAEQTKTLVTRYHEQEIIRPRRFMPSTDCLKWHREKVYMG